MLDERNQKEGIDVFVANYQTLQINASKKIASTCVWTEGITSLLPRTDMVGLCPRAALGWEPGTTTLANDEQPFMVRWDVAQETVGELMESLEGYPERYSVSAFPDQEQLTRLRAKDLLQHDPDFGFTDPS